MLRSLKAIAVLAILPGCGARDALHVMSGGSGGAGIGGAPSTSSASSSGPVTSATTSSGTVGNTMAHLVPACAPADGMALGLDIDGTSTCPGPANQEPGIQFLIWGPDLTGLHDGVTLHVSSDVNGFTTAGRLPAPYQPVINATSGVLIFTTFSPKQGATGTFDITLADGTTAQGSFEATACPGDAFCG
jgi:hypothetical protein